jgi:hypothetical protein
MSNQIVPITGLNTIGLVKDTPAIALPPNAFSDVMNVRFTNNGVTKMSGEVNILPSTTGNALVGNFIHIAWWANPNLTPNNGYFLAVTTDNTYDYVYLIRASDGYVRDLDVKVATGGNWQHTVYQGGYAIILNNGIVRPRYILDVDGNTNMANLDMYELPGWDSYYTTEEVFNDIFDPAIHLPEFDLGREVDFQTEQVVVAVFDTSDNTRKFLLEINSETTVDQGTLSFDESTNSHFVTLATAPGGSPPFTEHLEADDNVIVTIRSLGTVQVRCGVVKAWGDVLVAGNLTEINAPLVHTVNTTNNTITFSSNHSFSTGDVINISEPAFAKGLHTISSVVDTVTVEVSSLPSGTYDVTRYTVVSGSKTVRNQPGVVRISDVAQPGAIPHNWNPYSVGVSTAEEFTLATTGIIQDIAQMNGKLYVYTNNSIHVILRTGNPNIPYTADIASTTHGAMCLGAVQEFKGIHLVVGANDIYQFAGNSASIQSIADGRVRDYFYDSINGSYYDKTFLMLNTAQDEVWVNYATTSSTGNIDEQLIYNFKDNVWTRRNMTDVACGVMGNTKTWNDPNLSTNVDPSYLRPIFAVNQDIFGCDFNSTFTDKNNTSYESYIERIEAPMTPEFDVESLHSVALWATKDVSNNINLRFRFRPTDYPSQTFTNPLTSNSGDGSTNVIFAVGEEYKADVRMTARFSNFRLTDEGSVDDRWTISGMQLELKKGGRR